MKPSTSATVRPASAIALPRGVDRDRAERTLGVAHDRALRVAGDGHAIAGGEARTHRATSANAGTATPSPISSKVTVTRAAEVKRCVDAVREPADHPQLGLRVEFHVDEDVRHVVGEPGKERIAHHGPRTHGAAALDRFRHELGVGAPALGADDPGRKHVPAADAAARQREGSLGGGLPIACRANVWHRQRFGHACLGEQVVAGIAGRYHAILGARIVATGRSRSHGAREARWTPTHRSSTGWSRSTTT